MHKINLELELESSPGGIVKNKSIVKLLLNRSSTSSKNINPVTSLSGKLNLTGNVGLNILKFDKIKEVKTENGKQYLISSYFKLRDPFNILSASIFSGNLGILPNMSLPFISLILSTRSLNWSRA